MREKLLSVIVPVYNTEKYLKECINSILGQTYSNLELILLDDGSSDNSPFICKEYEKKDCRIKYIKQENQGVSRARNRALEECFGDYIAFVDSDDVIDLDCYEILIAQINKTNSDIAACSLVRELDSNIKKKDKNNDIPSVIEFPDKKACLESITAHKNSIQGFTGNKVFRRDVIKNIRYSEDILMCEDALFLWELVTKNVNKACFINLPMYHYRIHGSSSTRNSSVEKYYAALKAYKSMIISAKEQEVINCLNGLCSGYIMWNIVLSEQIFKNDCFNKKMYIKIRKNVYEYKEYIKYLSLGMHILARTILISYSCFRICLFFKILIKKILHRV